MNSAERPHYSPIELVYVARELHREFYDVLAKRSMGQIMRDAVDLMPQIADTVERLSKQGQLTPDERWLGRRRREQAEAMVAFLDARFEEDENRDPDRCILEIAGKRDIIRWWIETMEYNEASKIRLGGQWCDAPKLPPVLRALAFPYQDHPEYDLHDWNI